MCFRRFFLFFSFFLLCFSLLFLFLGAASPSELELLLSVEVEASRSRFSCWILRETVGAQRGDPEASRARWGRRSPSGAQRPRLRRPLVSSPPRGSNGQRPAAAVL